MNLTCFLVMVTQKRFTKELVRNPFPSLLLQKNPNAMYSCFLLGKKGKEIYVKPHGDYDKRNYQDVVSRSTSPQIRVEIPRMISITNRMTTDTTKASIPTPSAPSKPVS